MSANGVELITAPICHDERPLAVLVIETANCEVADDAERLLQICQEPFGRAWRDGERASNRWTQVAQRVLHRAGVKVALLALLALIGALYIPVQHTMLAPCRVEPLIRRWSVAPFDGILAEAKVSPGDEVEAGQVLATMDDRELREDLEEVQATMKTTTQQEELSLARGQIADAQYAALEMQRLRVQERSLLRQLGRLNIRASIDGIVLDGDWREQIGAPVETGRALFDVAPLDQVTIELRISEDDLAHVTTGLTTRIRLHGSLELEGRVDEILPVSDTDEEGHHFRARVTVPNDAGLKPGMEGQARIVAKTRRLGWVLVHKLWDRFSYRFF